MYSRELPAQITRLAYDAAGRVLHRENEDGTVTWQYVKNTLTLQRFTAEDWQKKRYDDENVTVQETLRLVTDEYGNLLEEHNQAGVFTHSYDVLGRHKAPLRCILITIAMDSCLPSIVIAVFTAMTPPPPGIHSHRLKLAPTPKSSGFPGSHYPSHPAVPAALAQVLPLGCRYAVALQSTDTDASVVARRCSRSCRAAYG